MLEIRRAADRGRASFGWLDSRHTFSFGHYYDPEHMGYSALRVINDDTVRAGAGFDTHGHQDMEIISYVLEGEIAHKDSAGNIKRLPAGEFQLMSAGKGIYHSEFNASQQDTLKFLQIWIQPDQLGGEPGYQQKDFGQREGLTPVITPDGENGTLSIKQDARLSQLILAVGESLTLTQQAGRRFYLHQIKGQLTVEGEILSPGDGLKVDHRPELIVSNQGDVSVTALVFDLP
ncbi:pirin family protein [Photobacterium sp. WH77]|uniref:pirin family protein n=1 Tax=unclassified Photobacterium TaxID=2628852 RepID=UPI001EDA8276|nr:MULTISPECIES: pirin family protein [unclassified Photobacterium]MCG2837498.1 pirin family protein [Photobacterium sp. WH77]MCG2845114.1 pirin family protein [Photobacterium sp. WH80]